MKEEKLRICPCGTVPANIMITPGNSSKWAYVSGTCCSEWSIEFRTEYKDIDSEECHELAVEAWNNAERKGSNEKQNTSSRT